ncbi:MULTISPECIES: SspB family protein [unclassified Roseitalea]|uniref:SspB family protein n=1 Tax=unclassified Roseitalea TaxID=2639107 RepID=UPI00273D9F3B|nr:MULTISPECIES: SspB family protein [unclassified Roseitalea]
MSEDIIRYDILVQNALRGVIRKVLSEVEKTGLPGNHHFFITFVTSAPGVRISNRIREQYPDQMTIVLQHQFWDLEVGETGFGIGLSFSDVPEKLYVPYAAVRGFYDPSVNFELEFDVETELAEEEAGEAPPPVSGRPEGDGKPAKAPAAADGAAAANAADEDAETADVVSLDAFRNKK